MKLGFLAPLCAIRYSAILVLLLVGGNLSAIGQHASVGSTAKLSKQLIREKPGKMSQAAPDRLSGKTQKTGDQKLTRYARFQKGKTVAYGIVEGDRLRQISGSPFGSWKPTKRTFALSEVKILVPCEPRKVLAVALNYKSHLGSLPDRSLPAQPEFFWKPTSCLIAPGEPILLPPGSTNVHYEGELVIVIGKKAKNVSKQDALDFVLGATCGNDVSARDWQKADIQWWRAKGADTFGPCGPFIVSGLNYDDLLLQLRQNGEVKQKQRTSDMAQSVSDIVSFASRFVTLEPGDLIYTGTPGITTPIHPGDILEVELEGVGILKNPVAGSK